MCPAQWTAFWAAVLKVGVGFLQIVIGAFFALWYGNLGAPRLKFAPA